ncbi:hypothetical protein BC332_12954 [Capsicum chinense]|nr:hypothetical protein BC332_12954 [Capsicum chinense]
MEDLTEIRSSDLSTFMFRYDNFPNYELDNLKQDHVVIVMVPFPIQGHLKQLLQLAGLISLSYELPVYYVGSSTLIRQARDVSSLPNVESYVFTCISAFNWYCFSCLLNGMSVQLQEELLKRLLSLEGEMPNEVRKFMSLQGPYMDIRSDDIHNTSKLIEGEFLDLLAQEVMELAMGLEQSKQKFIWVLREADRGDIFIGGARRLELPEEFEERVKGSSTMGVPIAAWPMHSDQPKNGFLVAEMLKIGLIVREWQKREELVSESTIENVVRKLMGSEEGDAIRKRAEELGEAITCFTEKGGTSRIELDSFIAHITR